MIGVSWKDLGKKFGLRWVFKNLSGTISPGEHVLIKGSNGSGKSTFGKLLVAASDPTSGSFQWEQNGTDISADELPQEIAWSSPFMEIPENITVSEALEFHSTFRAPWDDTKLTDLAKSSGLDKHLDAPIGTKSGLVVLDEPCSNLDERGIAWYRHQLAALVKKTTVVVCSNDKEFEFLPSATIIDLTKD